MDPPFIADPNALWLPFTCLWLFPPGLLAADLEHTCYGEAPPPPPADLFGAPGRGRPPAGVSCSVHSGLRICVPSIPTGSSCFPSFAKLELWAESSNRFKARVERPRSSSIESRSWRVGPLSQFSHGFIFS